ncbi:MAG: hypothetical protein LAO07_10755 [Acidobacteriia bacterium]|nr:hypothetical protein [Terriglobia bacterium]
MRTRSTFKHSLLLAGLLSALSGVLLLPVVVRAGGPLIVGGPGYGVEGQPFVWDTSAPVQYRVDGGPLARKPDGTVTVNNATGVARVQAMFQVWQNMPTANITFTYAGPLQSYGAFSDGDVSTVEEYDAVMGSCNDGVQSPVIFDADGSIFYQLLGDSAIIGFAGPCQLDPATGHILSAGGMFNGQNRDGINTPDSYPANYEMTAAEFDEAVAHELGHFVGLDHSQINTEVLFEPFGACSVDDLAGLPLMFPYAICQARSTAGLPMLAPDDLAWVSELYPETANAPPDRIPFNTRYGTLRGTILFSDGETPAQGLNVIARSTTTPQRVAVSVFSGYLFTGNPGQTVTGDNDFGTPLGSRNPLLMGTYDIPVPPGSYYVWVESVSPLLAGAELGPLYPPIPNPSHGEYWNANESATDHELTQDAVTVAAGAIVSDLNIILNGTPPRFDSFESSQLWLIDPPPAWLREEDLDPSPLEA